MRQKFFHNFPWLFPEDYQDETENDEVIASDEKGIQSEFEDIRKELHHLDARIMLLKQKIDIIDRVP